LLAKVERLGVGLLNKAILYFATPAPPPFEDKRGGE